MKFLLQLATTIVACALLQYFLPWWTIAIGALAAGYIFANKGYVSFLAGFFGVAILWSGMSLFLSLQTHGMLTEKVNNLLPVNAFVLTAVVGGLVGGFAAATGALLKGKI